MMSRLNEEYNNIIVEEIDAADEIIRNGEINFNSFSIKDVLNPEVFDKNDMLKKDVFKSLGKISAEIIDELNIPENIVDDIILVGSIVSYHYSSYSDFDLHIVLDMKKFNKNIELVRRLFDDERRIWNIEHNVTLKGYDVELYFQDIADEAESRGCYSVMENKWIKKPDMEDYVLDVEEIRNKAISYIDKIDSLVDAETPNLEVISHLCEKIMKDRKTSLKEDGEFGVGNIVFKILRRTGHIGKLWDLRKKIEDNELSK